ncbi:DUF3943 domain-containing protein [Pedobacter gandavensis]|uniref:DUF3943 domain-containing protein n=1 Tax=Pedobacter gandavensis TaxID=2679963 RepID=A0ABR6ESC4_9SPHI|nr:DUF3943 domain-containing protein [Pedobacter gandavensis]MBB2148158.1 DUF3943 domain-containing protein [Pedobacter gandavensis]
MSIISGFRTTLSLLFLSISIPIYAQSPAQEIEPDSLASPIIEIPAKKRFARAASSLLIAELIPWSFSKFITHAEFSNISLNSIKHNLKFSSWNWDDDAFPTNQIDHPYHGSVFFNSFRSNGFSFWQSAPAALVGSYIWETAGENQAPSKNDIINTTFGGITIGETVHRLTRKILQTRRRGFRRYLNETISLAINPTNGFRRIADGEWGKVPSRTEKLDTTLLQVEAESGIRKFNMRDDQANFGVYARLKLIYGNPFDNYKIPFSSFILNAEVGQDDSSFVNSVNIVGTVHGWLLNKNSRNRNLLSITSNYDYLNNQAYYYGSQSLNINLFSEFGLNTSTRIKTSLGMGPIMLAAFGENGIYNGRPYDYGAGAGVNGNAELNISNKFMFEAHYNGRFINTWNGNTSSYSSQNFVTELEYTLSKEITISTAPSLMLIQENYKNGPDVHKTIPGLKVGFKYRIAYD